MQALKNWRTSSCLQPVSRNHCWKTADRKRGLHHFRYSISFLFSLFLTTRPALGQYNFSETSALIEQNKGDLGDNIAAMIWKDGKLIYQKEIGNMRVDKVTPIASCSKWLTAALVMTFADEGKITLEDSIGKFLPIFSSFGKGHIKIKNRLSHTTGIDSGPMNLFTLLRENSFSSLKAEVENTARTKKLIARPGSEFRYSNYGLSIVARILETISFKSFETLFQERIAKPLDMINTTFGKGELVSPSGGARSTANDYMNFLEMILNKGMFRGKRILSEQSVAAMQEPQTNLSMIKYAPKGAEGFNYASGEWVQEADKNGHSIVLTSPGLFGSWPYVDNCRHYACVFMIKRFFINEQTKQIYLHIKETIDKQIPSDCQ